MEITFGGGFSQIQNIETSRRPEDKRAEVF